MNQKFKKLLNEIKPNNKIIHIVVNLDLNGIKKVDEI